MTEDKVCLQSSVSKRLKLNGNEIVNSGPLFIPPHNRDTSNLDFEPEDFEYCSEREL